MTTIQIIKGKDDPICPRISIGGTPQKGYYISYRGPEEDCNAMLKECAKKFTTLLEFSIKHGPPDITNPTP